MNYISVCSGIEAASAAWEPLGWTPIAFAEVDKFASKVLKKHYPKVVNVGDFTQIQGSEFGAVDLLVGGTPCQDFSVAGLRAGLDGERGKLTIEFARLAGRLRSRWLVWENVPGVLSADGGRAFGMFLGILGQLGYGVAYRVLDAQYAGVPQRRRRVFVVGYLGDWRRAAAVLFERHSLSGHPPPRRQARQVAPCLPSRSTAGGGLGTAFDCDGGLVTGCLNANGKAAGSATQQDAESGLLIFDTTQITSKTNRSRPEPGDPSGPLAASVHAPAIAFRVAGSVGVSRCLDCEIDIECFYLPGTDILAPILCPKCGDSPGFITYYESHGGNHQELAFDCKSSDRNGFGIGDTAPTLRAMGHADSHPNAGGQIAIAIQAGALRENPDSGPDGAGIRTDDTAYTLEARQEVQAVMTLAIRGRGDSHDLEYREDGIANAILTPNGGRAGIGVGAVAHTLRSNPRNNSNPNTEAAGLIPSIGWSEELTASVELAGTISRGGDGGRHEGVMTPSMAVRRLTPRECERLQSFRDDYTLLSAKTPDGPRYRALGNSMAVPVMRWIGERIAEVEKLPQS